MPILSSSYMERSQISTYVILISRAYIAVFDSASVAELRIMDGKSHSISESLSWRWHVSEIV